MRFFIGVIIGIIGGIILGIKMFSFWKKKYSEFLPLEDATVLKAICGTLEILGGIVTFGLIGALNIICIVLGILLFLLNYLILWGIGTYYKKISTKPSIY